MLISDAITQIYLSNTYVIKRNAEGLAHEESLFQPKPDANCLNWVIGHIVANRNVALTHLSQPAFWDQATIDRYQTGSPPVRPSAQTFWTWRLCWATWLPLKNC